MNDKFVKLANTISSEIQGETVMVNLDLGKYFALNEVASSIWKLLDTPRSSQEITQFLLEEFEISEEQCTLEVDQFLNELFRLKLIQVDDSN